MRKAGAAAWRAERRDAPVQCVGPAGHGSPRSDPGGSASNPGHASLRRAIPRVWGKENRRDYGRSPAPAQEQGLYRFANSEDSKPADLRAAPPPPNLNGVPIVAIGTAH